MSASAPSGNGGGDGRGGGVRLGRRLLLAAPLLTGAGPARSASPAPAPAPPGPEAAPGWEPYALLMWQDRSAAQLLGLRRLGFTGVKVRASGGEVDEAALHRARQAGLRVYLENIATDFYAAYHRWQPDRPVTALFEQARRAYRAGDPAAFHRSPGLSDPVWRQKVAERVAGLVRRYGSERPLFYNLADESGIADLAAAWDFDRSPEALLVFRAWLAAQGGGLDGLNARWGTRFPTWEAVEPWTTDQAIAAPDRNFAPWADFKAWMDVAFAEAVAAAAQAARAADPAALVALEGAQVPGWGGYDYARLAPALDVMEIYGAGNSMELALGFNPRLIALRTSFEDSPAAERHARWRHLFMGGRGTIVWDEADDVVAPDGSPARRGAMLAMEPLLARAARVLAGSVPAPDPVALLHSQASFRLRWLLDRRGGDHDWAARDAEREYDDNAWRAARRIMLRRLAALGVGPHLVTGAALADLSAQGVRLLLLAHAIALSDAEVASIAAFRAAGGTVLADTEPGLWDDHLRRRAAPPLPWVARPEPLRPLGERDPPALLTALAGVLAAAGAPPRARLLLPDRQPAPGVEMRWRQDAQGLLLSVIAASPVLTPPPLRLELAGPGRFTDLLGGEQGGAAPPLGGGPALFRVTA